MAEMREAAAWAWIALRRRCRDEGDWTLKRRTRWWLTAKALAFLAVGGLYRDRLDRRGDRWDYVTVGMGDVTKWSHPEFGAAADWDELVVARRGVGLAIRSDGYP